MSLVVLVVKGIFTHWKQSLPHDTVSHIKHAWYNQSDVVHNQRVDKVGKAFLESRISRASALQRPQTTGSLLRRNQNTGLIPKKRLKGENEKGIDDIVEKRKKFLLRGNGNITGFYNPVDGMVSSYQQSFKPCKSTKAIHRTAGNLYTSSIMTVTPDPALFKKQQDKKMKMTSDLEMIGKKFAGK